MTALLVWARAPCAPLSGNSRILSGRWYLRTGSGSSMVALSPCLRVTPLEFTAQSCVGQPPDRSGNGSPAVSAGDMSPSLSIARTMARPLRGVCRSGQLVPFGEATTCSNGPDGVGPSPARRMPRIVPLIDCCRPHPCSAPCPLSALLGWGALRWPAGDGSSVA